MRLCFFAFKNQTFLEWERGSLLKKHTHAFPNLVTNYYYNNMGQRFKNETSDGIVITYYLDGDKLLGERWSDGSTIKYIYDIDGIIGFVTSNVKSPYRFVKDAMGNVISVLDEDREVARYEYAVWGRCTVKKNIYGIGTHNPIRWKSQYYDNESGFYYIDGRYYSPDARQFISPLSPETAALNSGNIYGLNDYKSKPGYHNDSITQYKS